MKYVAPQRWPIVLCGYALGGFGFGLANPVLRAAATRLGIRPGFGTALDVNLLVPAFAILMALLYPRVRTACIGAVLLAGTFPIGPRLIQTPNIFRWSAGATLASISPILVGACVGCAVLGVIAALVVRPWRVVGILDAALRCRECGYLLIELPQPRCPECGAPFDPSCLPAERSSAPYS